MATFLFVIAGIWLLWNLQFREYYITIKYGKAKEINISSSLSKEALYSLLLKELKYPKMKEISWNEDGNIVLHGKYGEHVLTLDNDKLYVGRDNSHHAKNIEEAEVIGAYISKIFDVNAPTNPYKVYEKMISHKKNWILIQAGMILVCIVAFIYSAYNTGLDDMVVSKNISSSYLKEYSQSVTVGTAFDNFFEDGKWTQFSEGAVKYVDYSGSCLVDEKTANVVIRFWCSDTEYRVEKVFIDGVEASYIMQIALFEAIFGETNKDNVKDTDTMLGVNEEFIEDDEPIGDVGVEFSMEIVSEMVGTYSDIEGYGTQVIIEQNDYGMADIIFKSEGEEPDYVFESCCPVDNLFCFEINKDNQKIFIGMDGDGYLSVDGCEIKTYNTIYERIK